LEIHPNQPREFDPVRRHAILHDPNGQRYERWEEIEVTREIDRMRTDFHIAVSEHHLASARITGSKSGPGSSPATRERGAVRVQAGDRMWMTRLASISRVFAP
jgi:hypothetical protein